ncbi:hypothetical protein GE09DRAFT_1075182 [Coniochaeta sp. 2T2.1]|nr:hypothetical protein GE09DRAFT_1075182 [Coniochaeta sp. 2T2.1]
MAPSDPPAKLPVAPNMSQILNRISLGLAKHERILSTLKRPSPSTSNPNNSTKSASGFSSLASSNTSTNPSAQPPNGPSRTKDEEDKLFESERNLPPNTGIGFVPEAKTAERSKSGKELRGRLMGKRGGREDGKGDNKKRYYNVEESEEEEGRSGLGKKKKRKVVQPVPGVEDGRDEDVVDSGKDEEVNRDEDAKEGHVVLPHAEPEASVEPAAAAVFLPLEEEEPAKLGGNGSERSNPSADEAVGVEVDVDDAEELARDKKRKRKQAKRKRSRANKDKAQESADANSTPAAETDV